MLFCVSPDCITIESAIYNVKEVACSDELKIITQFNSLS